MGKGESPVTVELVMAGITTDNLKADSILGYLWTGRLMRLVLQITARRSVFGVGLRPGGLHRVGLHRECGKA